MRNTQRSNSRGCFLALLLGCFLLPSLSLAATVTYASNKVMGPTNGLVGYWTMNAQDINWTTNTILDRSGYGNNGILTNMATKTAPVAGKLGQGMRFIGGTTDRINAGSAASLDDITTLTVSFWVRPHSIWGYSTMISKGSWQGSGWALVFKGYDSHIAFLRDFAGTDGIWESNGTPTFKKDAWMHVTLTYDKSSVSNTPLIYVNGSRITLSTTTAPTGSVNPESSYNLHVGADGGGVMGSFPGSLDEVRIYNRILTPTEIKQLYNVGQVTVAAPSKKNASGLVGWWTFDGPDINWTTGTALDRSGQGNNGILTNMATRTSPVAGKLGQGLKFTGGSGSSKERIYLPENFPDPALRTISAWVKLSSSAGGVILSRSTMLSFAISTPAKLSFYKSALTTDGSWITQSGIPLRKWVHVAVSYDSTSAANLPIFYIDGIATSTVILQARVGAARAEGFTPMLGRQDTGSFGIDGSLDDVRVYNRILSPTEVAQLYKQGQVTINAFTCGVSTVKDADGNVYNTVKIGTQCWMKQNMRVGTMVTVTTTQTNNSIIEKHCYSNTLANCMTNNNPNYPDGGLYQWNEAMQYSTTPGARGICPAGWHIPTHDEFTTLERAVCTSGSCATNFPYDTTTTGYRGTNEGTKLKANGTSLFEGNLAGDSFMGSFENRGAYGVFWSSLGSGANIWSRTLVFGSAQVVRFTTDESLGLPVRCLQN